ncbi:hypothetical protein L6R50_19670 [Myxococcota bacterium]|nr:hypothetical protein [Myxococcota bacterium]
MKDGDVRPPPPGQDAVLSAGLTIGALMLGLQLWILTVALDLYLGGQGEAVWGLAAASAGVFGGGLLILWALGRRPRVRRPPASGGGSGGPAA